MDATAEGAHRRGRVILASLALLVTAVATWMLWPADQPARTVRTTVENDARAAEPRTQAEPTSVVGADDTPASTPWEDVVRLVARDLWSRDPLPDLDLRVTPPGRDELALRTDAHGAIEVAVDVIDEATTWECATGPYRVANSAREIGRDREIWCCRTGTVLGRVVLPRGLPEVLVAPLSSVTLAYSPAHLMPDGVPPADAGRYARLCREVSSRVDLPAPLEDGSFRVELPALRGAALVARLAGFRPAWEVLDEAALRGEREVVLELEPGMRIGGALHDREGAPLARVRMRLFVVIRMRYHDADADAIGRIKDRGYTVTRSAKDDRTVYTLVYEALTDEQGRWTADLDADGELFVIAYPGGHAAIDHDAGMASRFVDGPGLELVTHRDDGPVVRVCRGRHPVADRELELVDLSRADVQPVFRLRTDAEGRLQSPWLLAGKRYGVRPTGQREVYIRFLGQDRIDLEACETDVGRFLGSSE